MSDPVPDDWNTVYSRSAREFFKDPLVNDVLSDLEWHLMRKLPPGLALVVPRARSLSEDGDRPTTAALVAIVGSASPAEAYSAFDKLCAEWFRRWAHTRARAPASTMYTCWQLQSAAMLSHTVFRTAEELARATRALVVEDRRVYCTAIANRCEFVRELSLGEGCRGGLFGPAIVLDFFTGADRPSDLWGWEQNVQTLELVWDRERRLAPESESAWGGILWPLRPVHERRVVTLARAGGEQPSPAGAEREIGAAPEGWDMDRVEDEIRELVRRGELRSLSPAAQAWVIAAWLGADASGPALGPAVRGLLELFRAESGGEYLPLKFAAYAPVRRSRAEWADLLARRFCPSVAENFAQVLSDGQLGL